MTLAFLIATTIAYLILAIIWSTSDLFNGIMKIMFILLTIAGIGLLLTTLDLSIDPRFAKGFKALITLHSYTWISVIVFYGFGFIWKKSGWVNILSKTVIILIAILATVNLILV